MVDDIDDSVEVTALMTSEVSAPCSPSAIWSKILEQILEQEGKSFEEQQQTKL